MEISRFQYPTPFDNIGLVPLVSSLFFPNDKLLYLSYKKERHTLDMLHSHRI